MLSDEGKILFLVIFGLNKVILFVIVKIFIL